VLLTESKNTHMEHIEDLIFNDGVDGARNAINFLRDLRDMLSGHSRAPKNITVKWDGAPAIFAGIDPADGKFFIAKKGIFNKTPLLYKSVLEIKRDKKLPKELKYLFEIAFKQFSKLNIKDGVYQGDLMFTKNSIKKEKIEGEDYYTFHPNTIVYAIPVNSHGGRVVARAQIGIVWHTTYTGKSLESMSASFGKPIINKFNHPASVWMQDATYKDVSGTATFTSDENATVTSILSAAGTEFRKIKGNALRFIQNDEELKTKIKTYNNTHVRAGVPFPSPKDHVKGLYDYVDTWYQKEIDKKKTPASKQVWEEKRKNITQNVFIYSEDLTNMFTLMNHIINAKQIIINKLNKASSINTFLRTRTGFKTTSQEGFVAIDKVAGAIKLVDRLEFSRANFSPDILKGWQ
jgi:hypothetical protein